MGQGTKVSYMDQLPADKGEMKPKQSNRHGIDYSLPNKDYPMSDFEVGTSQRPPVVHRSEQPVNMNPDIVAGDQSASKYGLGRGKDGAI
jgi:hypothetical protein